MKEEQPEAKMVIDTSASIVAEEVTEEDMMAMMGFAGFGTTKVSPSLILFQSHSITDQTHLSRRVKP